MIPFISSETKFPCLIFPIMLTFFFSSDLLLRTSSVGALNSSPHLNKTVQLYFPTPILQGTDLTMNCRFKVNTTGQIYQVKWYKGRREIFRFTPSESPPSKILPLENVTDHIDEGRSDMNRLVLRRVPMALKGNISCEVSWESTFSTFTDTNQLLVVSPPKYPPDLNVTVADGPSVPYNKGTLKLNLGEVLSIRCTGGPSSPAPELSFYINEYDSRLTRGVNHISTECFPSAEGDNRSESCASLIRIKLDHSHFQGQKIRVKCNSKIFNLYNENSTEFIGEKQRENTIKASSYGGIGGNSRNSAPIAKIETENLIWSMLGVGVNLVLLPRLQGTSIWKL